MAKKDMMEIEDCPFCGGAGVLKHSPVKGYEPAEEYHVECSKCGQKRVNGSFDTVARTAAWAIKKAVEAWNTRPPVWQTGIPTEEGDYLVHSVYKDDEDETWEFDEIMRKQELQTCIERSNGLLLLHEVKGWCKYKPYKEQTK